MADGSKKRYSQFSYKRGVQFPFPPSVPSPVQKPVDVQKAEEIINASEAAKTRRLLNKGIDGPVILFGSLTDPWFDAADTRIAVPVMTFVVPDGRVFEIRSLEWKIDHPFLQASLDVAVQVTISGREVPFWRDFSHDLTVFPSPGFLSVTLGDMEAPLPMEPIIAGAGEPVVISLAREQSPSTFLDAVQIFVEVVGELKKPVGGAI